MPTYAIEAEDLVKRYKGGVLALNGVDLAVEEGTVFGLLGPNGAGKTTAVRIFTTTLVPDSGWAKVLGLDVVHHAEEVRGAIGLAGQFAAVDENLTGYENLRLIGQLNQLGRRRSVQRSRELLGRFGLEEAADRPAKTFSGGQRRRLDVAASLVARPSILFLDEPTTGLDPQSRNDLWVMIEELVAEGTTVLLTTQYLEEADRLASIVAVVDHGKVIAQGTPEQLKSKMGRTVLELEMSSADDAAATAEALQRLGSEAPQLTGAKVEVTVDNGAEFLTRALRSLDRRKLVPLHLALREPSLDDVFLALTGHRAEEDPVEPGTKGAKS
ncbi:MAG TPA: ATP-binding cassette domain-containing protein [Acidimicrobiales bacterium]|nr:ATP-binding cassette domain-containing protein [Acidimicrobiales bacterium]